MGGGVTEDCGAEACLVEVGRSLSLSTGGWWEDPSTTGILEERDHLHFSKRPTTFL